MGASGLLSVRMTFRERQIETKCLMKKKNQPDQQFMEIFLLQSNGKGSLQAGLGLLAFCQAQRAFWESSD